MSDTSQPKPRASVPTAEPVRDDLVVRLISALVLAGLTLMAVISGSWPFAAFICALGLVVAWEWVRLFRERERNYSGCLAVTCASVVVACILSAIGTPHFAIVLVVAGAALSALMGMPNRAVSAGLGVLYVGSTAIVLIYLRGDAAYGTLGVVYVLLVVWTVDTAALVFGRTFGGWRLFPSVSPNKTWAGAIGGLVGGVCASVAFAQALPGAHGGSLAIIGLALGLATLAGDLFESALKRHFGRKDASGLIPGHGGVLDRIDGLVFAAIGAAVLSLAINSAAPAEGLLTWVAPWWR